MQTIASRSSLRRDEIEVSLQGKYGLSLTPRTASSTAGHGAHSKGANQGSAHTTRDEVERLLLTKYGVGFVRRQTVAARDEIAALLQGKYEMTLQKQ